MREMIEMTEKGRGVKQEESEKQHQRNLDSIKNS